jgi:3alpha(or 20beta)-hydroxysteroid dehydrogenase
MLERLHGKVALITGAASGLGEAVARAFVREGATVVIADVDEEGGARLAGELGDGATYIRLDVSSREDWAAATNLCEGRLGGVSVLVNNAGISAPARVLEETSWGDYRGVMDTNLDGVWLGMASVLPVMKQRRSGSIVNISSIDGLVGVAGMSSYVASKFAVTGLTRSAALEAGSYTVRVNAIHPGFIDTPGLRRAAAEAQERFHRLMERQAIPRLGHPEEVAAAAVFLASDEASFCTGSSLVVDGGHVAGPHREGLAGPDESL